jgi:hypothetical protein
MKKSFLFFIIILVIGNLTATDVSGNQTGTWNLAGSPYNLVGQVTIPAGENLTIEAGVEVVAMGNFRITALGTIQAQGAYADTIRFYGNGGLNWGGIRLEDENNASSLNYCRISNTNGTNDYGIHAINSPIYIDHCFIDNHLKGIQFSGLSTNNPAYMEITNSKVANVQRSGITVVDNSNVLIDNCEITQCGLGATYYGAIQLSLQSNSHSCNPTISNNYIHHNGKQGLTLANLFNYSYMAPTVIDNEIAYNLTGIYLYNGKGYFKGNFIHDNFIENDPNSGAGVMLYGSGADAVFSYNVVCYNYTGFYLQNDATANLGDLTNAATDDDGFNCIYDNIFFDDTEYSVYNMSALDVIAQNNVWDDDPAIDITIIDGNDNPAYGFVNYLPTLSPWAPPDSVYMSDDYIFEVIGVAYPTYKELSPINQINVYLDGVLIDSYQIGTPIELTGLNFGTDYVFGATYIYDDGESIPTEIEFTYLPNLIFNPPQNPSVTSYGLFNWDPPEPGSTSNFLNYNVFLDGNLVGSSTTPPWQFNGLTSGQTYFAEVSAIYEDGESEYVGTEFIYLPTFNPPQNPVVNPPGLMSWEEPIPGSTSVFLYYNAYLDDILQGNTTDLYWQFTNIIPGQAYLAEVSAVYEAGESEQVEAIWEQIDHDPPANAGYEVFPDHIHLYWQEPGIYVGEYHIYVNGEMFSTTELFFDIYDLISGMEYEIALTALYIDGIESDPILFNIIWVGSDDILFTETRLIGNYPNPFNPTTTISFSLAAEDVFGAKLEIYNLRGQKIKVFEQADFSRGFLSPNEYSVIWMGKDETGKSVSSGVYFYQLKTADKIFLRRMLMLK